MSLDPSSFIMSATVRIDTHTLSAQFYPVTKPPGFSNFHWFEEITELLLHIYKLYPNFYPFSVKANQCFRDILGLLILVLP